MTETPQETVAQIRALITTLDEQIMKLVDSSPDTTQAAELLAEMNFLKRDMSVVYDTFSHAMAGIMGKTESLMLSDGTEIEKKSSYDRKGWDHKGLASAVADKLTQMSIDMDTGEVVKTPKEIALEMITYCAPSYWRIKELTKIGINADNYSEVGDLRTSIIVRKAKDQ